MYCIRTFVVYIHWLDSETTTRNFNIYLGFKLKRHRFSFFFFLQRYVSHCDCQWSVLLVVFGSVCCIFSVFKPILEILNITYLIENNSLFFCSNSFSFVAVIFRRFKHIPIVFSDVKIAFHLQSNSNKYSINKIGKSCDIWNEFFFSFMVKSRCHTFIHINQKWNNYLSVTVFSKIINVFFFSIFHNQDQTDQYSFT